MKQKLFFLLYLFDLVSGIVSILQPVSRNYFLILKRQTWADAQTYCRMMYTDLAIIISVADHIQLKKETTRKGLTEPAWIGLYDDYNSWRWSLNNILLMNTNFRNWNIGEPNNYLGKESCVIIMGTSGFWGDKVCTGLRPFICYNDKFSGADRFIGVSSPLLTWLGAQAYCRTYHTDLASALNSSDNDLITQIRNIQGDSWFGLYRETWKWLNGTNATNLPWYPGQPNNNWGTEYCSPVFQGLFIDEECANLHYFFCFTVSPVRSQIMRVQVQSDGSVLDPAVQSYILEQMKQKLDDVAMLENITMAWRVQPDGNIFHKKNKHDL